MSYCQDGGSGYTLAVAHSYCYELLMLRTYVDALKTYIRVYLYACSSEFNCCIQTIATIYSLQKNYMPSTPVSCNTTHTHLSLVCQMLCSQ